MAFLTLDACAHDFYCLSKPSRTSMIYSTRANIVHCRMQVSILSPPKALSELDEVLAQSDLSDSARARLNIVRGELASPLYQQMMTKSPNNVSMMSHGVLSNQPDDLEASRWMAQTFNSRFGTPSTTQHPGECEAPPPLPFQSEGIPALELSSTSASPQLPFSRGPCRHKPALATLEERQASFDAMNTAAGGELTFIPTIGDDTFELRGVQHSLGLTDRSMFLSVCASAMSHYGLITTLNIDVPRWVAFLIAVYDSYAARENPFHCPLRTADVVQLVHAFLQQRYVSENLSDIEILATLIGTIGMNAGHCGVSNEFLARIRHTTTLIFGTECTIEHASLSITNELMEREDTNFMVNCDAWSDSPQVQHSFSTILTAVIVGTATQRHASLMQSLSLIVNKGFIGDDDIQYILGGAVRAANHGFTIKPRWEHIHWVTLLLTEHARQGCEEERRRLPPSPLCGSDAGEHASAAISAMIQCVVTPLFDYLAPLLPPSWSQHLLRNRKMYQVAAATSGREDDDQATSPPILFEPEETGDWIDTANPSVAAIRKLVGGGAPSLDRKASQHAILHATPHRQLSMSAFSDNGSQPLNRTEHYFSLLKLFENFDREGRSFTDFGGNVLFLATQLDPLYLGEYASQGSLRTQQECGRAAELILDTELPPSSADGFASPTKRNRQHTDAFLLQLLHMYKRNDERRANEGQQVTNASLLAKRRIQSNNPIYAPRATGQM